MTLPEGMMPFDRFKYEAAIAAAPPGTMIKMGDLEKPMVRCTTCGGEMDEAASKFHTHPKKCGACGEHFDENLEKHTPIHFDKTAGAGTVRFTSGCTKEAL